MAPFAMAASSSSGPSPPCKGRRTLSTTRAPPSTAAASSITVAPAPANAWSGTDAAVGDSGAGLIVNTTRPAELADAMTRLSTNEALRRRMQESAINLAKSCSWEKVFDDMWRLNTTAPASTGDCHPAPAATVLPRISRAAVLT